LQGLGAGAPTLALDTPFNAEVLPFPEQRFPHDAKVLAERIRSVVASPAAQEEMRQRGRSVINESYSWDDVCQAYMEMLVGLASN